MRSKVDLQLEGKVEWASRIARFAACLPAIRIVFVGLSEPSPLLAPASGCLENRAAIQYTPENPPENPPEIPAKKLQ